VQQPEEEEVMLSSSTTTTTSNMNMNMDTVTEVDNNNSFSRIEDQIVAMSYSDGFCNHSETESSNNNRREFSRRVPARSRSFDRRGAALLSDMLKSAMTVAAQVSPESTLKGGGTGRAHSRSSNVRGTSPSAPKRSRSEVLSFEALTFEAEAEDTFEEDLTPRVDIPSFEPQHMKPSCSNDYETNDYETNEE
jgi:hypothetical protein